LAQHQPRAKMSDMREADPRFSVSISHSESAICPFADDLDDHYVSHFA
jgi:hypothetical protein